MAAVVAYHLGYLRGGYLGVDLFFVLSGFLITSLLLREGEGRGRVDLRRFWVRRARRLLPALGLALVGVVVAARIWLDHSRLPALRTDALATAGYVANWRFATQAVGGYFAADPSPLRHTWSLAIEEQYYVVWPLVVVAALAVARRRSARPALAIGIVAALGAAGSTLWMAAHAGAWSTDRLYLGTDTRVAAPLVGALLACVLRGRAATSPGRWQRPATVVGTAALAGLGVAVVTVGATEGWMYRGGFALMALLGAAAVAGGVLGGEGPLGRALAFEPLRWVGERSYGLYLYSWPIQVVLTAEGLGGAALAAATVGLATAGSAASFRFLEMPIRRGRSPQAAVGATPEPARARRARRLAAPGVALSVLVVLGLVVAGTVTRARPDPLEALTDDELHVQALRPARATPQAAAGETRVMVAGDSIGFTLGTGAPGELPGLAPVDARAVTGCGLITEGERPPEAVALGVSERYDECAPLEASAEEQGLAGQPDVVLLVTGAWESSEHERDGRTVGPGDAGWTRYIRGLLEEKITALSATGAVVALWAGPCGPDDDARARQRWFTDEVLVPVARARGEAEVIRPAEVVCADGAIRTDVPADGDLRMADGEHWTSEGAAWLWREWLGPALRELAAARPAPPDPDDPHPGRAGGR